MNVMLKSFTNFLKSTEDFNKQYTVKNIRLNTQFDQPNSTRENLVDQGEISSRDNINIFNPLFMQKERDENLRDLRRAIEDFENLNYNFDKIFFNNKKLFNEIEIGKHLLSLKDQAGGKDIDYMKNSIQLIYEEIISHVGDMREKMRVEIHNKKKDIQNKTMMYLADAEYNHKLLLEQKINDQKEMLNGLNQVTKEMLKTKESYEKVRKMIDFYLISNAELTKRIQEESSKNKNYKLSLKKYKIFLNNLYNRVDEGKTIPRLKITTSSGGELSTADTRGIYSVQTYSTAYNTYENYQNQIFQKNCSKYKKINNTATSLRDVEKRNELGIQNLKIFHLNKNKEIDFVNKNLTTIKFFKAPDILQKNLKIIKNKVSTVKKETDFINSTEMPLSNRVYQLMKKVKLKTQELEDPFKEGRQELNISSIQSYNASKIGFYSTSTRNLNNKFKFPKLNKSSNVSKYGQINKSLTQSTAFSTQYQVTNTEQTYNCIPVFNTDGNWENNFSGNLNLSDKNFQNFKFEERKRFIDALTKDPAILEMINDKHFPTINVTYRKVNLQK
jgi:hypothetical protein